MTWFQTATGDWHWPSILTALAWFVGFSVAGVFMFVSLKVNRADRVSAAEAAKAAGEAAIKDREKIESANKKAAELEENARISAAQLKATETELAVTKKSVEKMETNMAPRVITAEQRAQFLKASENQLKTGRVFILYIADAETTVYAQKLNTLFREAGYTSTCALTPGSFPVGITLAVKSVKDLPPHAEGLLVAVKSSLPDVNKGCEDPRISKNDEVRVFVGPRPQR